MNALIGKVQSGRLVYGVAALLSLFLSVSLYFQQDIINPDAVCYLLSAQQVGQGGLSAAMHLCGQAAWPLYSVLIYTISAISTLSLTSSAYLLNGFFTLVSVLAFIALTATLGGSRRAVWLAAFVILSAHQFNGVRDYIVRDHGFWAFYLISMLFMLRFLQQNNWLNAVGFGVSLVLAALFRVEGAVFLVFLPLLVWFQPDKHWRQRLTDYCKLNMTGCLALGMLGIWLLTHAPAAYEKLGRLPELTHQILQGFTVVAAQYSKAKSILATQLLPAEAVRDAGPIWVSVMLVMFCWNIISNVSWLTLMLLVYASVAGVISAFSRTVRLVLFSYFTVNIVIAAFFFADRLFFSKRYLIALVLVLLLIVPFALEKLLYSTAVRQRVAAYLAMAVLLISSLGVMLPLGTSKAHIREAGTWMAANLPASAALYTNDIQLAYYSAHFGYSIFAMMRANEKTLPSWQAYDYAALRVNRHHDERVTAMLVSLHADVRQRFANKSGDQVIVYQIPHVADARGG